MFSSIELLDLHDLNEKCELLLEKNTIKKNNILKNKVKSLITKIDDGKSKIFQYDVKIRNEQTNFEKIHEYENKIQQVLIELNNEYNELFSGYTELKNRPFYKKAYSGIKNRFSNNSTINETTLPVQDIEPVRATQVVTEDDFDDPNFLNTFGIKLPQAQVTQNFDNIPTAEATLYENYPSAPSIPLKEYDLPSAPPVPLREYDLPSAPPIPLEEYVFPSVPPIPENQKNERRQLANLGGRKTTRRRKTSRKRKTIKRRKTHKRKTRKY